jgi:DNA-directed RNA polymerase specialized sigma24 family protein
VEDLVSVRSAATVERHKTHGLSDTDLIMAMRQDRQFAFVEFIDRFRHLAWNEARGLGVDVSVRKTWTEEVLHDCALALTRSGARTPANVAGYVIVAVRRRLFADRRKIVSEDVLLVAYAQELDSIENGEPARMPEPLMRLAENLAAQLGDDDEALLEWKRRKLGYTQAAAWLGVKRDTVAHRTIRLTARLQKAAQLFLETLSDEEIRIIRRFASGKGRGDK